MDTEALMVARICECGTSVWFPDFPPPGAIMSFEEQLASVGQDLNQKFQDIARLAGFGTSQTKRGR